MTENWKSAVDMMTQKGEIFKPYKLDDFACKCGCGTTLRDDYFVEFMNFLFSKTNKMYKINSGMRCEKHNGRVKGKENSDHLKGKAIDIETVTIEDRSLVVHYAFVYGIPRAIVYPLKKFVHLSINKSLTCPLIIFNVNNDIL